MSSIFGIIQFNQKPLEAETLQKMQQTLNHWNADDTGVWQKGSVGLGHLMLWNTPESLHEKLPLHHTESGCTITADARIDNREELFTKLNIEHWLRKEIPDSILILKAYEKYGEDCVKHLIGDFAFAIWDEKEQKIFCARDHMGVKPFFYYQDENIFAFASEKKGILCLDNIDKAIDKQFFYNQLIVPTTQALDTTLYEKIRRLKPALTITVNPFKKELRFNKYWDLDAFTETKLSNQKDYYDGLLHHFEQAVICRIRTAFSVGSELSGGLDSSAITSAAHQFLKQNGRQIISFSNTFAAGIIEENLLRHGEREYIDMVIAYNKISKAVFITDDIWNNPLDGVDFVLTVNDGIELCNPFWQLPLIYAAHENNVRSMLSGFVGDQLVTSQNKVYFLDYLDQKNYIGYWMAKQKYTPKFNKLHPFIPNYFADLLAKQKQKFGFNNAINSACRIYNIPPKYKKTLSHFFRDDRVSKEKFRSYRHFQKCGLLMPLVTHRMETETRFGLYFKIEPRFPMADIRLTQYYLSMPNQIKYTGKLSRSAFRIAVQKYLPPSIRERDSKAGSIAPFLLLVDRKKTEQEKLKIVQSLPNIPFIKKNIVIQNINYYLQKEKSDNIDRFKTIYSVPVPELYILRWAEKNWPK